MKSITICCTRNKHADIKHTDTHTHTHEVTNTLSTRNEFTQIGKYKNIFNIWNLKRDKKMK